MQWSTQDFKEHLMISAAFSRSAFGKVYVYNLLPCIVAEQRTIKGFQRLLQRGLVNACRAGLPLWPKFLSEGAKQVSVESFQRMFTLH